VGRLEDGDDARDGGFDDRSAAQLLFRTDSHWNTLPPAGRSPSRAIVQGQPGTNVCEPREGFQPDHRPDAPIQPHGRFETSMIRGVRFTTTLECVCRDAQLTSAMATSVRATPGDRVSAELPSQTRGSVQDRGHRNNAHQDRRKAGSGCAAAVPTGVCICWNGAIVRGGGSPVRLDPPRKRRLAIEGPWRGTRSPREDRPSEAGNGARWYRPILGARP
jgi:hypothetical protein